jgi:tripartite-type tricarboxylate transporter receptor subunit TctC
MRFLTRLLACVFVASGIGSAFAQTYPDRPVRIILAIAPGSVSDVIMRAAAAELSARMGQQFIVDNRGGASGILAAQACAQAPPDGYTICGFSHAAQVFNPLIFNKLPYDPDKDFALISRLYFLIEALAVNPGLNVNSVAELMQLVKSKPSALNYGTLGPGSPPELFLKWLNNQWGASIVGIPYRGGGPIAQALAAGDIQIGNMGLGNFLGLAQAGKLKLLAVASSQRSTLMPDVPTYTEAGIGRYAWHGWWGLVAPAKTPQPIIERLNAEVVKLHRDPAFVAFLHKQSVAAAPTSVEEYAAFIQKDRETAAALIKLANTPRQDFKPEK